MRNVRLAACLIAVVGLGSTASQGETFTFFYDSDPGDFIGQGGTATWTEADGTWFASRNFDNGVGFNFSEAGGPSFWSLDFAAPDEVELSVQTYSDAQRFPFQDAGRPGLSVTGEGRGCNTLTGSFSVNSVVYDWYGEPVEFSASFEQHCEGATPALNGTMDYDLEFGGLPPAEGNILLTFEDRVYEYTVAGDFVQVVPILESQGAPPSSTETVRDLTLDANGRVHVYNGTFSPVLSSGDPVSATWEHSTFDGWSTVNNVTYGGIASQAPFVYVTDMIGADSGIVRFDASDSFSGERFEAGTDYIDLNLGLDGRLYGLRSDGDSVDVFDPATMTLTGGVNLDEPVRGIAINAAGEIFGVPLGTTIYRFDANGVEIDSLVTTERFADIDIASDGTIVAGADDAAVVVTTEALDVFSVFNVGTGFESVFVTFVPSSSFFEDDFESGDTSAWSVTVPSVR